MSNDVQKLLKAALDPSTGSKELREIWSQTTSTRVRKAVAANPNCNTATMAIAARLYIKEVIGNPSFEIQKVFNEDKIVEQIYDAYMNPQVFSKTRSPYQYRDLTLKNNVAKAMLVSPHLKDISVWEKFIFPSLSSQEITRELKDNGIRDNLKQLVLRKISSDVDESSMNSLYASSMFLFDSGVVSKEDISVLLGKLKTQSNYTSRKAFLSKFYLFLKSSDYPALFKYTAVGNSGCLKHVIKDIKDKKFQITDENVNCFVWLYRDFLRMETEIINSQYHYKKKRYGWVSNCSFNDTHHSFYLSQILWEYVSARSGVNTTSVENLDLGSLFEAIKRCGFDKDYGPHPCELKFYHLNILTARNIICRKLLDLKDDCAFEFYMACGLLWEDWYAKSNSDNLESQVVERMHKINGKREFKYYKTSTLDIFPTIRITKFSGIECNHESYQAGNNKLPKDSGNLPKEIITSYVQRAGIL